MNFQDAGREYRDAFQTTEDAGSETTWPQATTIWGRGVDEQRGKESESELGLSDRWAGGEAGSHTPAGSSVVTKTDGGWEGGSDKAHQPLEPTNASPTDPGPPTTWRPPRAFVLESWTPACSCAAPCWLPPPLGGCVATLGLHDCKCSSQWHHPIPCGGNAVGKDGECVRCQTPSSRW
jgi:hypothetical protein